MDARRGAWKRGKDTIVIRCKRMKITEILSMSMDGQKNIADTWTTSRESEWEWMSQHWRTFFSDLFTQACSTQATLIAIQHGHVVHHETGTCPHVSNDEWVRRCSKHSSFTGPEQRDRCGLDWPSGERTTSSVCSSLSRSRQRRRLAAWERSHPLDAPRNLDSAPSRQRQVEVLDLTSHTFGLPSQWTKADFREIFSWARDVTHTDYSNFPCCPKETGVRAFFHVGRPAISATRATECACAFQSARP